MESLIAGQAGPFRQSGPGRRRAPLGLTALVALASVMLPHGGLVSPAQFVVSAVFVLICGAALFVLS